MLPDRAGLARRWAATLAAGLTMSALLGPAPARAAPEQEAEPPDAQARAVAALPGVVLGIVAQPPKAILGLVGGTSGEVKSIAGTLKELNARVLGREIQISLSADVLFDFDKADLRAAAAATLAKVAAVIRAEAGSTVRIEGHTDSKGDDAYNRKLSERRAESVRRWLAEKEGIDAGRIATRGRGETQPVAPNVKPDGSDDPAGRQKNRRVEILVTRKG